MLSSSPRSEGPDEKDDHEHTTDLTTDALGEIACETYEEMPGRWV
jgi:hypothetical protein